MMIIVQVIGYIARLIAYNETGSLPIYAIQAVFLVLPPVFYAATLYMVYSRVVRAVHGESMSLITPRWTTTIFVIGDAVCLNIQSSGSGLLAKDSVAKIGSWIVVGGLTIQIFLFVSFLICCFTWNSRFTRHVAQVGDSTGVPWKSCLHMLYTTSIVILVRNIYRIAEFALGRDGYLMANEWPQYVFDGALMLIVMATFYFWHPANLIQTDRLHSNVELDQQASGPDSIYKSREASV